LTTHRLKRPALERRHPIRAWTTLFQPAESASAAMASSAGPAEEPAARPTNGAPTADAIGSGGPVADTVERGYRVVNEYIRQAQSFAEGVNSAPWMNPEKSGAPQDPQQLAQRVMQYGWDFAGLWFEMWTRMAGASSGWPTPAGAPPAVPFPKPPEPSAQAHPSRPGANQSNASRPMRLAVSIACQRRVTTIVELRSGPASALVIHALRAEGMDAPAIRDITIESSGSDETVTVRVVVEASQPPGTYNGMIVDTVSNLPRGTLSLTIHGDDTR
jgi:hypothetical protein